MKRTMVLVWLVMGGSVGLSWAQSSVLFVDGFESGGKCSWTSEFVACDVGTEMVFSNPTNGFTMTFKYVPAGTFMMGAYPGELSAYSHESPQHRVTLTRGFWLGKFEVTQAQWQQVTGTPMSTDCGTHGVGSSYPVYCVSRDEITGASGFIAKLNLAFGTSAFRLPSEAEWEYAARAGRRTRFFHGEGWAPCDEFNGFCTEHDENMWYGGNATTGHPTHPVGQKPPNSFGLYDMHGNVWEWTADWFSSTYYSSSPEMNPLGPTGGDEPVLRGGSMNDTAQFCRLAARDGYPPQFGYYTIGFRVAMTDP